MNKLSIRKTNEQSHERSNDLMSDEQSDEQTIDHTNKQCACVVLVWEWEWEGVSGLPCNGLGCLGDCPLPLYL
jgi:hypothetical protein